MSRRPPPRRTHDDHAPPPPPRATSSAWNPSFPFPVEYNDHFETPLQAYRDIQPMVDWLFQDGEGHGDGDGDTAPTGSPRDGRSRRPSPILYDPYYCNGASKWHLESLGYRNVVHERRDFYDDVRSRSVPIHDVLVTNPPYSDDHKARCLDFCCSQLARTNATKPVPFFVLVPTYVASKAYYRSCLRKHGLGGGGGEDSKIEGVVYLVPNRSSGGSHNSDPNATGTSWGGDGYRYEHPEATGHDSSPFDSLWICGIGRDRARTVREWWDTFHRRGRPDDTRRGSADVDAAAPNVTLYCSLDELERAGAISTERRPNPRQRRKRRKVGTAGPRDATAAGNVVSDSPEAKKVQGASKQSKYRDESGKRKRGRF